MEHQSFPLIKKQTQVALLAGKAREDEITADTVSRTFSKPP